MNLLCASTPRAPLTVFAMSERPRKIILPGGSGFLGKLLAQYFHSCGWHVVVLTRHPRRLSFAAEVCEWDGRSPGDWRFHLEGAAALVNLAGRSVNCRYSAKNRDRILTSRVESTRAIGQAIAGCTVPPAVWLNSSTATIYKHSFDQPMDEATGIIAATAEAKDAFSIEVATAWEDEFAAAITPATRKVALRTAMVLDTEPGTVYRVLRRLVRLGLGGRMGTGNQYVSWIHEADFCRAIGWLIEDSSLSGPVNVAAPQPVTNWELMRTLRQVCDVPCGLPATRWMLELGAFLLRTETELIIKSRRVVPARLLNDGFVFQFPDVASAIDQLERSRTDCLRACLGTCAVE
jgi:uncharacterized protein